MARGYLMVPQGTSAEGADVEFDAPHSIHVSRSSSEGRRLRYVTTALWTVALAACVLFVAHDDSQATQLVSRSTSQFRNVLLDLVSADQKKEMYSASRPMLIQAVLAETAEGDCDEACKMIKDRVKRAWTIGMEMFKACGDRELEGCGDVSKGTCDCEKRAGNVMCSELEYAWEELCPTTQSEEMHKGVCSGETITQTREMCQKVEMLPGVLISHFPGGQAGLGIIDDAFVHKNPAEDCAECGAPEPPAAEAPPAEEEPPAEGGAEGGEVASGMDASARRRA